MTKQELNRDIKRVYKAYKNRIEPKTDSDWQEYNKQMDYIKSELKRLYGADKEFEYMTKLSILMMLELNRKVRAIPFHWFGIHIENLI